MAETKPTVVSLVGARPQFIKLAPLAGALAKKFRHVIVHSGQHYDPMMSDVFFRELTIPRVDYHLGVGSGTHGRMTGKILIGFEKIIRERKPHLVLVYGDTNSTLAGALAAAKEHVPLGHVEAGLRSYRKEMPEEVNRVLTDHVSELLFCPTRQARINLRAEGIKKGLITSGDLMYELIDTLKARITANRRVLAHFGLAPRDYLVLTLHRAGNVDSADSLEKVIGILGKIDRPVLFPVHPRTRKNLTRFGLWKKLTALNNVILSEPLSYLDNLSLLSGARAVLTDSGGIQKESTYLGTPVLTLRAETEWVETLRRGNHLVGLSERKILSALKKIRPRSGRRSCRIRGNKPSAIIVAALIDFFRKKDLVR